MKVQHKERKKVPNGKGVHHEPSHPGVLCKEMTKITDELLDEILKENENEWKQYLEKHLPVVRTLESCDRTL